jgi:MFS family permease
MISWRRNLFAITAAGFVGFTGFTLVMPFLPLYIRELGVSDVGEIALWTGVTLGVTPALTALCSPFWGRVADRYGNKLMVQRSLVSFVIIMTAMAFVSRAWHLFALRAVLGFFAGYGPLTLSMAAQSAPREKLAVAIGTVQTAHRLGPALGPVIGGILAPLVGVRRAFLASAGLYALALFVVSFLYREPERFATGTATANGRVAFRSILAFENFLLLMLVIFGLQLVDRSFGPVLPLYVGQLGYAREQVPVIAGVLFSTLAFSAALGNQLSARLLRRVSARALIAAAAVCAAAGLALFATARPVWALGVAMAIVGICIGTATTAAYTAAGSVIPAEVHSTGFGFLTSASLVGLALSPVVSGLVGAQSIRVVFLSGVVVLVLLAVVVRRVMVDRQLRPEPAPSVEDA